MSFCRTGFVRKDIANLKKIGIPFALRVKIARLGRKDLRGWLMDNFPAGGVERRCMDPQCDCKDIAVYEGPLVVRRNRMRDGKKVKTERVKMCRFRLDGGVILSFECWKGE